MLVGSSPMKGGRRGVVAWASASVSSWKLFAWEMSIGRVPDSLARPSKMVRAGDGGMESTRLMGTGLVIGLARAEEAVELARERRSSGNISASPPEPRFFQRADMVEMCELMRETPFIDTLSERRFFGEGAVSMPVSLRS